MTVSNVIDVKDIFWKARKRGWSDKELNNAVWFYENKYRMKKGLDVQPEERHFIRVLLYRAFKKGIINERERRQHRRQWLGELVIS